MSARWIELIGGPFRASWRAALGWTVAFVVLIVSTMAFWPAFRGSSGISTAIDQLPAPLLTAFGLEGFGTPAGYLRGGLYELVMPLCFAAAGVLFANSATAVRRTPAVSSCSSPSPSRAPPSSPAARSLSSPGSGC